MPLRGVNFARRSGVNIESRLTLKAFDPEVSPLRSLAGRLFRVSLASGRSDEELLEIIRRIPGVGSAEVDASVRARGGTASESGVGRHRMGE